jgi:phosphoglycolate phosphatase-like HAD superfamily hydrolase
VGAGVAQAHHALGGGPTFVVGDSYIDGLAAARAEVAARFVGFRPDVSDLAARGVRAWATISALSELPSVLGG